MHQRRLVDRWDAVARRLDRTRGFGGLYHDRLEDVFRFLVPPGQRVLEVGCARGDTLAALEPSVGVGIDISPEMVDRAKTRHPELTFILSDAAEFELGAAGVDERSFDYIILSDLLNEAWDAQAVLEHVAKYCVPETRVIVSGYSRLWELPLRLASRFGLANSGRSANWLDLNDTINLLYLEDLEAVRSWPEFLFPIRVPLVHQFFNRFLVKLWPFRLFALANLVVARPRPRPAIGSAPTVSVIVPARNEAGNIAQILERTPDLGGGTELVFVEGHSSDDTYAEIERQIATHPERRAQLHRQTGAGKGDAVRLGFSRATGEVLMILDADLTVPPEDLPRFYQALVSGRGEFINGTRLVYPMEDEAMRFANLVANKFFSLAFSWLLGQRVKDTLCGTKVLRKRDYELIAANRSYFGEFDPFGDYDLLFGAARLSRKIVDLHIRYRERQYGTTNIQRWRHGVVLLRMTAFASTRIKFV